MSREIRMVPKEWVHPKRENGSYQPMYEECYEDTFNEWLEEKKQWGLGFQKDWENGGFKKKEDDNLDVPFKEWAGEAPDSRYYMPKREKKEKTHFMMYETTSEGTPISPAFDTPEKLAKWLADNQASAFANQTATYEEWLKMIKGPGYAPSAIMENGKLKSGVSGL